jgi:hypothetical protein
MISVNQNMRHPRPHSQTRWRVNAARAIDPISISSNADVRVSAVVQPASGPLLRQKQPE